MLLGIMLLPFTCFQPTRTSKIKVLHIMKMHAFRLNLRVVFNNTQSGSCVANECLMQCGAHGLPFGGTGQSGCMCIPHLIYLVYLLAYAWHSAGSTIGKYSFDMFTHLRASMDSPSWYVYLLCSVWSYLTPHIGSIRFSVADSLHTLYAYQLLHFIMRGCWPLPHLSLPSSISPNFSLCHHGLQIPRPSWLRPRTEFQKGGKRYS